MKTILLIEDNPEMRENTSEILELSSYNVLTAENGKVGVTLAKMHNPDIIICDIMMPELDGWGVLHILGKDPVTASIPFIFLTAKTEKEDLRRGMNLGADDYITKPFEDTELLKAIETRIKKSEVFNQEFQQNKDGFDAFIDTARGVKELDQLCEDKKHRIYKKKDIIFYEGDYPNKIYFIRKGKIKTYKTNDEGKEYITGLHNEGDFLGYLALLEGVDYTESAMALEECEVSIIPKHDFFDLLNKNRDVAHKFIKILSQNLVSTETRLLQLAYTSVRKRVAEALLFLHNKNEGAGNFQKLITRDDLAKIVGTAKETVIRTLSDFKDEKLIEIEGREISIVNIEKLTRLRN